MSDPRGIDVAYPQGPSHDWRQWRAKIGFGMCKVTEGLTITGCLSTPTRDSPRPGRARA